jgi:hypothetical protein
MLILLMPQGDPPLSWRKRDRKVLFVRPPTPR